MNISKIFLTYHNIPEELIDYLALESEQLFQCTVLAKNLPVFDCDFAFDKQRRQFNAQKILKAVKKNVATDEAMLVVVPFDAFIPSLEFVFGLSLPRSRVAIVSNCRLKPEFFGERLDDILYKKRVLKETAQQLGHIFKLGHCSDKSCLMNFTKTIAEMDYKSVMFCRDCRERIIDNGDAV